jgi:hypothetical protein
MKKNFYIEHLEDRVEVLLLLMSETSATFDDVFYLLNVGFHLCGFALEYQKYYGY